MQKENKINQAHEIDWPSHLQTESLYEICECNHFISDHNGACKVWRCYCLKYTEKIFENNY